MTSGSSPHLRVLLAVGQDAHLEQIADVLTSLGHSVIGTVADVGELAAQSAQAPADVAIVALDESSAHALQLISMIVRESAVPVIAVLRVEDPAFVREAAKRGVFAYITNGEASGERFESAIDILLRRFAEYHDLQGAFGRRAITERAKGILMERHRIGEDAAFNMLRDQSRSTGRKLIDVAQVVLDAHRLLPNQSEEHQDHRW